MGRQSWGGRTRLGEQVVAKCPMAAGMGSKDKGWQGSRMQDCTRRCVQGYTQRRSLSTASLGMGPIDFSSFSLLFHLPPTISLISYIFPGYSKLGRVRIQMEKCKGGDADGTALGNCSLPSSFGSSRSSIPWGLNSSRHKRGRFSFQDAISH